MQSKPWTADEEQWLKDMYEANLPYSNIAEHMKKTRSAIGGKCQRLGLTKKKESLDGSK